MSQTKLSKSIVSLAVMFLVFGAQAAWVSASPYEGMQSAVQDTTLAQNSDALLVIGTLINTILGLLGVALVIIMIYAGALWGFFSSGDSAKIKKAKDMVFNAVIGLLIVFAAYAITNYVLGAISGAAIGISNVAF